MIHVSECRLIGKETAAETTRNPFPEANGGDRSILLSRDETAIRRHPRFAVTRDITIARLVALGQTSPLHRRVLLEEGRCMILLLILAMHATRDPAECATWPTLRRLQLLV